MAIGGPDADARGFKDDNPCLAEHDASLKCQVKYGRSEICEPLVAAYKACMKEWQAKIKADRQAEAGGSDLDIFKRLIGFGSGDNSAESQNSSGRTGK
mmetsp:Transcript_37851/g.67867  ORF Transcript_37851/g.67867 Transcript_37851/m.67867 type:complete len:98 (+) Transcript_37851:219-512(+)|eukprot:CAMPEP_0177762808 /NCGR_PEP_ID=MMETSP0491_2-20121128/6539_1 /TAXON_ID=63592 /ORGANISM="Tetraselmis chuii, Strain PLY429" /LENGTH=97 /DNA_ID=CAMNT_0019278881 /DNA_START=278 /DNA_END=571 /DNA_ORIENTATION=-